LTISLILYQFTRDLFGLSPGDCEAVLERFGKQTDFADDVCSDLDSLDGPATE